MKAALDELARRVPGAKLGVMGFCFGGGMVWALLDHIEPRLAAAVPFYGPGRTRPTSPATRRRSTRSTTNSIRA
jgi:carboxymethylenebutenolidase